MNELTQFIEAMREAGIDPDCEIIADGKIHRFHVEGDRPRTENGWYVLYADEIFAGAFGCWKRGVSEHWSSKRESYMSAEEKDRFRRRMEEARKQRAKELIRIQTECRELSKQIWEKARRASNSNPYLKLKGVRAYGVRENYDSLVIPVRDVACLLHGLQFIAPDGTKKFKFGTAKSGHYHSFGKIKDNTILICEGYATGATLHEATGHAVVVAFDAGNLKSVAIALRNKYPNFRFIICADNDVGTDGNPGLVKATEAARMVNGLLAIPVFPENVLGGNNE